jgi:polysaccharide chain length determinant protein (PEP-CTERM system associated)
MISLASDPRVRVLLGEVVKNRRTLVGAFATINVVALALGFVLPQGYAASATIQVTEKSIIQPLMQGAAPTTDVMDRAKIAREIISSRSVINRVCDEAGWTTPATPADQRDGLVASITRRTTITSTGKNLIKVEFRDVNPERAFRTTAKLADIFISESLAAKVGESQSAFEFIDKQTTEYHQKLMGMEENLKDFRVANLDVQLGQGAEGDLNSRMGTLQTRIEQSMQELKETEIKKQSLIKQISGEAESSSVLSREGQYRQRIGELTNQLETLRMSYHETYPDIVHLRAQIAELKNAVAAERQRRQSQEKGAGGDVAVDDSVLNNPMYQQLKRDLSQTQITIDTLQARVAEARQQLNGVLERGKRIHGGETTLSELTRDYQVTRDIYQDLLRRRENARVSMNMDKENQGLTFRIQDPATLPTEPSGLLFWHWLVIGMLLGIVGPMAVLYGLIQMDTRIREPRVLEARLTPPMLVTVPHLWSPGEIGVLHRDVATLSMVVMGVTAAVFFSALLRVAGVW